MSQQGGSSSTGAAPAISLSPLDIEIHTVRVGRIELLPESSITTPRFFDMASILLPGYNEPNSIMAEYLQKLNAGVSEDGILDTAGFQTLHEIEDLIFVIGGQLFQDLAGPNLPDGSSIMLGEVLNPRHFRLQMITVGGKATLIHRQEFTPPALSFEHQDMSGVRGDLPTFDVSQIEILETIVPRRAYKVLANGRIQFCKVTGRGFEHAAIGRDCQMLQRIQDAGLANSIRVRKLEGLITTHQQLGAVIGFLTNYIALGSPLDALDGLRDNMDQVSKAQREDWASIERLHGIEVIWGNVCPRNMLLDVEGNLWVVGFSGARTSGFISLELTESMEGDLMGLEMIRKYLQV